MVEGTNKFFSKRSTVVSVSEVSLRIRFSIPRAAFGLDFFIFLSPNMKNVFNLVMAMRLF